MTPDDIEKLKRECVDRCRHPQSKICKPVIVEASAISRTIDYLHQRNLLAGDGVVVPREPTYEMVNAGFQAYYRPVPSESYPAVVNLIYDAMLAAAPGERGEDAAE